MYMLPRGKKLLRADPVEFVAFVIAYVELLLAYWDAQDRQRPGRANPVPLPYLRKKGIADHILLWLLYQGHVEHLQSADNEYACGSQVSGKNSLILTKSSCFTLTERGAVCTEDFLSAALVLNGPIAFQALWDRLLVGLLTPWYDRDNRALSWGRHVLKCFRQPSMNQELVLYAAEELGWDPWFDDPLPRRPGTNPKILLHDTIKDLNRRQVPHFIHFRGDGTGKRVGWEYR
jgi:hypothetical protein